MANKPTPPQAQRSLGERLYGDEISKKRSEERKKKYDQGKTPVFPGAPTRGKVHTPNDVKEMKKDHDMILDPDGKVRKYKRDKIA